MWQSKYGKDFEFYAKMDEENRSDPNWKTPTAIASMPEIEVWEAPYVTAFYKLTHSRQSGMGLGAIPLSEILSYCMFYNQPDPELFIDVIQRADSAYLEHHYKEQETKKPKK